VIAHHYQGNLWMSGFAVYSFFLGSQVLWGAWQRDRAGMPVDFKAVTGISLLFFGFCALAIFEVLTHDR